MSTYGSKISFTVFGQSHAPAVGMTLTGLPAGEAIDLEELQKFLAKRSPGRSPLMTARKEADIPEFVSGFAAPPADSAAAHDADGSAALTQLITCGAPITAVIRNTDVRSADYERLRFVPRPGHADYPAFVKYNGKNDYRGGGVFSARLTAPLCVAGGILRQILARKGIRIGAHVYALGGINDSPFSPSIVSKRDFDMLEDMELPVLDDKAGEGMQEAILRAKAEKDSIGGIIECAVTGLPAGKGDVLYDSLEGLISQAVFGIPAVRGIEFGAGFAAAQMRGSEHNDPFIYRNGTVQTSTNNHGGILGGLTTGMPVIFRAAFKPTPSIAQPQRTVNLVTKEEVTLEIQGRHDPCVVPRAVPCVISAAALAIAQTML